MSIYFVELKGTDFHHAFDQIYNTIQLMKHHIKNYHVYGRIVCTRIKIPNHKSTHQIRLERELKKLKGNLREVTIGEINILFKRTNQKASS